MMGASPLPLPQGSTPPGFAAFLATIGQAPSGGEAGGFDQLLAAAPVNGLATIKIEAAVPAANTVAAAKTAVAVPMPATAAIQMPVPMPMAVPAIETGVVKTGVAVDAPAVTVKADETSVDPDTDAVVASAEKLLIAAKGSIPAALPTAGKAVASEPGSKTESASVLQPKTGKPVEVEVGVEAKVEVDAKVEVKVEAKLDAESKTDDARPAAPETQVAVATPDQAGPAEPAANWTAVVAATPLAASVVGKPAKASEAAALPTGNAAPADETTPIAPLATKPRSPDEKPAAPTSDAAPIAAMAGKPRAAAPPVPALVIAGSERAAAKPAEAAPAMTVLFMQPAAPGTILPTDAARPIAGAERLLDIDSDGAWIDQLAQDIAATKSDRGDISFRLMPRHLGRLDVAMVMGDEGVALKMDTQHEATATIVTAAQGRLVDELRQQGVRVAGSEVSCTPGETGRQSQSQGQGRAAASDPAHLIETATERAKARDKEEAADRRGRFA